MAKLKELLFKPKWQHKDPAVRSRAVAQHSEAALVEALPEIARNDPSADVRLQAVRRLDDLYHLMRVAAEDNDDKVRDQAYRGYRAMLAGEHRSNPSLAERLEIIPRLDDVAMIEYLAVSGQEEAVREAAIVKVSRQGLLGDIAINESSPKLRRLAASQIEQRSTLERVAETSRRHDKRVYRLVTDRLAATGDTDPNRAAEADALALCKAVDELSRSDTFKEQKAERLAELQSQWDALPEAVRDKHRQRFEGASRIVIRTVEAQPASRSDETPEVRALKLELDSALTEAHDANEEMGLHPLQLLVDRLAKLESPVAEHLDDDAQRRLTTSRERLESLRQRVLEAHPVNPRLMALVEQVESLPNNRVNPRQLGQLSERWDQAWKAMPHSTPNDHGLADRFKAAIARHEDVLGRRAEQRDQALDRLDEEVGSLEQHLEDGDLAQAARQHQRLAQTLNLIGSHPRTENTDFRARLNAARGRLHEVRDWQHWANNEVRIRLCEEVEALAGSGLHPDAVAEKIKGLRAEWRELADSEKLPGDNPKRMPAPGLYRRFQAACNKAFKPAKQFFEKRDEVRQHHLEDMEALATQIEAAVADRSIDDFKLLERLVRDGRRTMRDLVNVPPKARGPMSRRLREGANALDERLEEQYQVVERRKQRLIDEVAALDAESDLEQAISAAKDAQRRWQEAGHTRRRREQKLWKEFRAASDRVFNRLSEQRAEERAEEQARYASLDQILEEAEAVLGRAADEVDQVESHLRRLRDDWRRIGLVHRPREQRFQDLCRRIEDVASSAVAEQALARQRAMRELAGLCRQAETRWFGATVDLDALRRQGDELIGDTPPPAPLAERWQAALEGDAPSDDEIQAQVEAGRQICIELEFLSGVESPAEFQQQRMDYQVSRLSRRMSGEQTMKPREEADVLEQRWYACGPLPPDEAEALTGRFHEAVSRLDEDLRKQAG